MSMVTRGSSGVMVEWLVGAVGGLRHHRFLGVPTIVGLEALGSLWSLGHWFSSGLPSGRGQRVLEVVDPTSSMCTPSLCVILVFQNNIAPLLSMVVQALGDPEVV